MPGLIGFLIFMIFLVVLSQATTYDSPYVIKVKALRNIAKRYSGSNYDPEAIRYEFSSLYPENIPKRQSVSFMDFKAGGIRGKLSILYASTNEFLAIFWLSRRSKGSAEIVKRITADPHHMNVSVTVLRGSLADKTNKNLYLEGENYTFRIGKPSTIGLYFDSRALIYARGNLVLELIGILDRLLAASDLSSSDESVIAWIIHMANDPANILLIAVALLTISYFGYNSLKASLRKLYLSLLNALSATARPPAKIELLTNYGEQNPTIEEIHNTVRELSRLRREREQFFDFKLLGKIEVNNKTYEIQHILGEGSFGSAYEAIDSLTGTAVAIKEVLFSTSTQLNDESIMRIQSARNEVEFLKVLNSNLNAIQLIDHELKPDGVRIVMECGKLNLLNLLVGIDDVRLRFDTTGLRYIWKEILLAVKTVHGRGIIHGDIKMDNFLFAGNELLKLKLIDFGCAHDMYPNDVNSNHWFISRLVIAPEHLQEGENKLKFRPSTDVWALGKLLYEMLYRIYAYNDNEDFLRLLQSRPNADSVSIPGCPEHQIAIVKQCLDEEWSRRPTIADLLAKVNSLTTGIDVGS